jgi:hypothetical protein
LTVTAPESARRSRRAVLVVVAVVAAISATALPALAALPRATADRPDDLPHRTQQIHVLYVLASDGDDRALDTDGTIHTSVAVAQQWMSDQTAGKPFRLDTFGGQLDTTFVRLAQTEAALAPQGSALVDTFAAEVAARGFSDRFKVYAVYYDGPTAEACGSGQTPGHTVALYLDGQLTDPAFLDCALNVFAGAGGPPGYWEFSFEHELVHAMGAVPSCAPHSDGAGHTNDTPTDLMYAGPLAWQPSVLDPGHDDYYGHARSDCLDLASSGYLVGNPPSALPGETLPEDETVVPDDPPPRNGPPPVQASKTSTSFTRVPGTVRTRRRFELQARVRSRAGTPVGKCLFYRLRDGRRSLVATARSRSGKCTVHVSARRAGWIRHSVQFAGSSKWRDSAARSKRTRVLRRPR